MFLHPSVMGHIEWFRKNLYDSHFIRIEDYELWLRTNFKKSFSKFNVTIDVL